MPRLSVAPEGPVLFGQRVTVTLTAMTPVRFAAPPSFPDLALRGRAIVLPEGTTAPGTERVGGQSLAALQRQSGERARHIRRHQMPSRLCSLPE